MISEVCDGTARELGERVDGVSQITRETRRILIVEDDDSGREALAMLLAEEGYTIDTARNGIEALALVDLRRPDLILSDVLMPHAGGLELAARLRTHADWAQIPIMLVTAWGEPRAVPDGLEDLAEASMHKPIDFDGLLLRIEAELARSLAR